MLDYQNTRVCRDLAKEARIEADAVTDVDLQHSYIELAEDYEMLADTLERIHRKLGLSEPTDP
jgi:hypothetical protein